MSKYDPQKHFKPKKPTKTERLYLWKEFPNEKDYPKSYSEYAAKQGVKIPKPLPLYDEKIDAIRCDGGFGTKI